MTYKSKILSFLTLAFLFFLQNNISAQITASVEEGCLPLEVNFSSSLENVKSYQWSFGNGQNASLAEPSILFEEVGEFDVELVVTLNNNTQKTYTETDLIEVFAIPEASFNVNQNILCIDAPVQFQNNSSGALTYQWSFGDGNQSDMANPTHSYSSSGMYTVTLKATGTGGCQNIVVQEDVIEVIAASDIDIAVNTMAQCLDGSGIHFELTGNPVNAEWDFGDGNGTNNLQATHTYTSVGEYAVSVVVEDENGCSRSIQLEDSISVIETAFPEIKVSDNSICTGQQIVLEALTSEEATYEWTLSDGRTFTGKAVEITFPQPGAFDVELKFSNENGCESTIESSSFVTVQSVSAPSFSYSAVSGCAPFDFEISNNTTEAIAYEWIIDGETLSGKELDYIFNKPGKYQITARTSYQNGCIIETVLEEEVHVFAVETNVSVSQDQACVPLETNFDLTNANVTDVQWETGTGEIIKGKSVDFKYTDPGIFYPKLTYVNDKGCTITYEFENPITVYDSVISLNDPEVIESCTYTEVAFSGDMGHDFWEWDFGDGNVSSEKNPMHSYANAGTYIISLTTNNKNGCRTTIKNYNIIEIPDINPNATFNIIPEEECGLFRVELQTTLKDGESAYWFYNETIVSTKSEFSLSFVTLEDVNITLRIYGTGECSKSKSIVINNPWSDCENPDIAAEDDEEDEESGPLTKHEFKSCTTPFWVDYTNPAPYAEEIQWTFSDGTTRSDDNFTIKYTNPGTFTVDFYAKFSKDSSFLVEDYITVNIENPLVDFTYEVKVVCDSFEVAFTPTNPDFEYYNWKINNKHVKLEAGGKYFFQKEGLYQVSLSASGQKTCEATSIKNVYIGNQEHAFNYSKEVCLGEALNVTHNLQGYKSFAWDIGNGDTILGDHLSYIFAASGEYQIQLLATDYDNCTHTFALSEKVKVQNPLASFKANKTSGCGNHQVTFKNESAGSDKWLWDFGNGQTSTVKNPKITFSPGTYTVKLTAFSGGCSNEIILEDYIIVDELTSEFSYQQNQDCLPVEVTFKDESINAVEWLWEFGDGDSSIQQHPVHIYTSNPAKPVKLTVTNASGCSVVTEQKMEHIFNAGFEADQTKSCGPASIQFTALNEQSVSWRWEFGDGKISTEANPLHVYTKPGLYTVQLIATNANGCEDTVRIENYIEVPELTAGFSLRSPVVSACVPVQVSFQNSAVGASEYLWDFGDGKTSTVANPLHVYTTVGEFDVKLIVTNDFGCTDTLKTANLVITKGPETKFSVAEKVICMPNEAVFTDLSANAVEWQWFFGDGTTSDEPSPSHNYTNAGVYKVTLIAKNIDGCQQSYSIDNIKVLPTPKPKFDMVVSGECYPVEVKITNNSTDLLNPSYIWDFGDGVKSTEADPVYSYKKPGTYSVNLTVKNDGGCPVEMSGDVTILVRDTISHKEAKVQSVWVEENLARFELEPYNYNNISHYKVMRKTSDGFKLLGSVSPSEVSLYEDKTCQPQNMTYEYVFQAISYCDDTVGIDKLTHYNTLHLTKKHIEERKIEWNAHKGLPADNYRVFRKAIDATNWDEIAVSDINIHKFQDNEYLCPGEYMYRVASFAENKLLSTSNPVSFHVNDEVFRNQQADIKTTTVMESGEIFTEWTVPEAGRERITKYELFRSVNGGEFKFHAEIAPQNQHFIDAEADSKANEYAYRIDVINECAIDAPQSEESNNILLKKQNQFRKYELNWNAYKGWEEGVLKYIIQRQNENGEWEDVMEVEGDQTKSIIRKQDD